MIYDIYYIQPNKNRSITGPSLVPQSKSKDFRSMQRTILSKFSSQGKIYLNRFEDFSSIFLYVGHTVLIC